MSKLSIRTCVNALHGAALSRKTVLQIELAVGFGVFFVEDGTSKIARQALCEAYASAGYQCLHHEDADYKTVNRRINATADLFNTIGIKSVRRWVGQHNESRMLDALVEGLRPYELYTVSDVQRYCDPVAAIPAGPQIAATPAPSILAGPTATGQAKIVAMFRRSADHPLEGSRRLATEHLSLVVPPAINRDELVVLAMQLLEMSKEFEKIAA